MLREFGDIRGGRGVAGSLLRDNEEWQRWARSQASLPVMVNTVALVLRHKLLGNCEKPLVGHGELS